MAQPKLVLLFSGKRKSGKDYITDLLHKKLQNKSTIVKISEPVKSDYANQHKLNLQELMSDGPYKEIYRKAMITWSDSIRAKDPGYFCALASQQAEEKDIWIVSDIRRKTDIKWFMENYPNVSKIRITADEAIRKARGWKFTSGVDDVASECDLDDFTNWDLIVSNNRSHSYENILELILNIVKIYAQI